MLIGKSAMVRVPAHSDLEQAGYGKRLDAERLMLSAVELLYLMGENVLTLRQGSDTISTADLLALARESDREVGGRARSIPSPAGA